MEKRIFGIILTILGMVGLIMAAMEFARNRDLSGDWRGLVVYGVLGVIFFFTGIGLIRSTRDVINRNEHIS